MFTSSRIVLLILLSSFLAGLIRRTFRLSKVLAHVKQHLKIVSGIIKSHSTILNTKMTMNYQKNFGKLKSTVEHQKSYGKLSEYVTYNRNSKCCLLCLNEKYEIATCKGDNPLNKRTEIINTCRHRSK